MLCDPEKNTRCKKTNCYYNGGTCSHTSNPRYAKKTLGIQKRSIERREYQRNYYEQVTKPKKEKKK